MVFSNKNMNGNKVAPENGDMQVHQSNVPIEEHNLDKDESLFERCMTRDTLDTVAMLMAEVLGTGLLMFLGCMGCVDGLFTEHRPTPFEMSMTFGFTVMIVMQIFGCVSGAHVNPSVTIAALIYDMISLRMALGYIIAQIIGAYLGLGLLKLLTPSEILVTNQMLCTTIPHIQLSDYQAFAIEFFATAILIFICCAVWDPRNAKNTDSVPLRFGFAVACISVVAGGYTGASMNPARSLAPAIWSGVFEKHWIYWSAPPLAAFVVSITYRLVFKREAPEDPIDRIEVLLMQHREKCGV